MELNYLTDKALLQDTKQLAQEYRSVTTKLLHHLKEIEIRKLYSDLGYSSLFQYVVQELGFSESSASRRIDAMRLLKEIPEIETKLNNGELTLSNLGKAALTFKKENVRDINFKKEVLACIENTSSRTCEKTLSEIINPQIIEVPSITYRNIPLREDIFDIYEKIRGLLASHHLSRDEVIEKIFIIALKHIETKKFRTNSKLPPTASTSRYIPAGMRKAVFERDQVCVICGSSYDPEIDHIKPIALGGETTLDNLRLLCRSCNQRARIRSNLHIP